MTLLSYYPGCTAHSTAWEFNESTHGVFETLGYGLEEIPDWNCCGGASAHNLDRFVGLGLPARNLALAQKKGCDLLIPCAGCYGNCKKAEAALKDGGADGRKLEGVLGFQWSESIRVLSLVDFLEMPGVLDAIRSKAKKQLSKLKVVAYYGCQLVRPPKVSGARSWENPTALEAACEAVGARVFDWSYKVDCCGADLALTHGDRAAAICSKLAEKAKEAGANAIVVSCGLCQANLEMRQGGAGLPILYITEVLGEAFQLPGRQKWWKKHIASPAGLFA